MPTSLPEPNTAPAGWASIVFGDDHLGYALTDEDVLWTARATVFEGGDPAAVLWTLTQRFEHFQHYGSFAGFVRAFSQPVNPRWARDGDFCRPGGAYAGSSYCSEDKLTRRARASSANLRQLRQIDPVAVALVLRWARADLPNPVPRATNFASPHEADTYLRDTPGAAVVRRAGDVYLAEPWARDWDADHVLMVSPDGRVAGAETPTRAFFREVAARVTVPVNPVRFWRSWRS